MHSAKATEYFSLRSPFLTLLAMMFDIPYANSVERAEVIATAPSSWRQKMKIKKTMCPPILNLKTNLVSRFFEAAVSGHVSFSTSPWVRLFQYEYVKGWKQWVYKDALFLWLWQADTKGRCVYCTVNVNDSWTVFQKRKTITTNEGSTRFPCTTFERWSRG